MPSLVAQCVKRPLAMKEMQVWSLGWEDPLEKEMATCSSILPRKSTGRRAWATVNGVTRIGHDLVTEPPPPYIPTNIVSLKIIVQLLSCVQFFVTPWTAACQASLSFTISQSLFKFMSIESMMPSNHHPLSFPSPPALNLSQHQGLFQWIRSLHQVTKLLELELQHQSFQWTFRVNFL